MTRRFQTDRVQGFIHEARSDCGFALTHGAGTNCEAPLVVAAADAIASGGVTVLRFDLAFRRKRRFGPPHPSGASPDRESIRDAVTALRESVNGPVLIGGHSYGGRQATMLAAEEPDITPALILLSYPLHPPNKPEQLRTSHFPALRCPALFVHGDSDPFGTPDELRRALELIPARAELMVINGAGHDLKKGRLDFSPMMAWLESACPGENLPPRPVQADR